TRMFLALRPAVVRGTCAHACENGAAADSAPFAEPATLVVAVADVATIRIAAAAPTRSQRRLCIDSLRIECAGSSLPWAAPARSNAPAGGAPFRLYDDGAVA